MSQHTGTENTTVAPGECCNKTFHLCPQKWPQDARGPTMPPVLPIGTSSKVVENDVLSQVSFERELLSDQ
jgi:hypothetical protein